VKQGNKIISAALTMSVTAVLAMLILPVTGKSAEVTHPELNEQEMLIACSECHRESTPDLEKEWYNSAHGIAMVKCYQCHGTFETFRVTPTRENCAACHQNMMDKCPKDKACWDCHVPHSFKVAK